MCAHANVIITHHIQVFVIGNKSNLIFFYASAEIYLRFYKIILQQVPHSKNINFKLSYYQKNKTWNTNFFKGPPNAVAYKKRVLRINTTVSIYIYIYINTLRIHSKILENKKIKYFSSYTRSSMALKIRYSTTAVIPALSVQNNHSL